MFYGEYCHSIDRKGRLILPAKIREAAKANFIEKFYITCGLDKCLFMFSEEEWKSQEQKFKAMPFADKESRVFNRFFFSRAMEIIPDRQGRVLLPQYLKDHAEITKDIVIIGVSNRIDIWSNARWQEFKAAWSESFEDVAESLMKKPAKE